MCIFIFLNIFYIYLLFIHSDSINLEFLYLKVVTFVETRRTNLRVPCVVHVQPASFPPLVSCVWRQNCCWFSWSHTGRTVYCVSFVFFLLFTRSTPTLTWSHPNNTYCPLLTPTAPSVLDPRVRQSRLVLVRYSILPPNRWRRRRLYMWHMPKADSDAQHHISSATVWSQRLENVTAPLPDGHMWALHRPVLM